IRYSASRAAEPAFDRFEQPESEPVRAARLMRAGVPLTLLCQVLPVDKAVYALNIGNLIDVRARLRCAGVMSVMQQAARFRPVLSVKHLPAWPPSGSRLARCADERGCADDMGSTQEAPGPCAGAKG